MKRNGFTLVEMLAVLCVIGILMIIAVPSYITVFTAVRRTNYKSKISVIELAGEKYASTIKDYVKCYYDNTCKVEIVESKENASQTYGHVTVDYNGKNSENTTGACLSVEVNTLIKMGYIISDEEGNPTGTGVIEYMTSPIDNSPMLGKVFLCYNYDTYDVDAYYAVAFDSTQNYSEGEKVYSKSNKVYQAKRDYEGLYIPSSDCSSFKEDDKDNYIDKTSVNGTEPNEVVSCAKKNYFNLLNTYPKNE